MESDMQQEISMYMLAIAGSAVVVRRTTIAGMRDNIILAIKKKAKE